MPNAFSQLLSLILVLSVNVSWAFSNGFSPPENGVSPRAILFSEEALSPVAQEVRRPIGINWRERRWEGHAALLDRKLIFIFKLDFVFRQNDDVAQTLEHLLSATGQEGISLEDYGGPYRKLVDEAFHLFYSDPRTAMLGKILMPDDVTIVPAAADHPLSNLPWHALVYVDPRTKTIVIHERFLQWLSRRPGSVKNLAGVLGHENVERPASGFWRGTHRLARALYPESAAIEDRLSHEGHAVDSLQPSTPAGRNLNLNEALALAALELFPRAKKKGVALRLSLPEEDILAASSQGQESTPLHDTLVEAIRNVLSKAPRGTIVHVTLHADDPRAVVSIQNRRSTGSMSHELSATTVTFSRHRFSLRMFERRGDRPFIVPSTPPQVSDLLVILSHLPFPFLHQSLSNGEIMDISYLDLYHHQTLPRILSEGREIQFLLPLRNGDEYSLIWDGNLMSAGVIPELPSSPFPMIQVPTLKVIWEDGSQRLQFAIPGRRLREFQRLKLPVLGGVGDFSWEIIQDPSELRLQRTKTNLVFSNKKKVSITDGKTARRLSGGRFAISFPELRKGDERLEEWVSREFSRVVRNQTGLTLSADDVHRLAVHPFEEKDLSDWLPERTTADVRHSIFLTAPNAIRDFDLRAGDQALPVARAWAKSLGALWRENDPDFSAIVETAMKRALSVALLEMPAVLREATIVGEANPFSVRPLNFLQKVEWDELLTSLFFSSWISMQEVKNPELKIETGHNLEGNYVRISDRMVTEPKTQTRPLEIIPSDMSSIPTLERLKRLLQDLGGSFEYELNAFGGATVTIRWPHPTSKRNPKKNAADRAA